MHIDGKSLIVGAALALICALGMGQAMVGGQPGPTAPISGGNGAAAAAVGRYQLVAADGRMWIFDTATTDLRNVRVDAGGDVVTVYVPRVTYDRNPNMPPVEPFLSTGAPARSAPARGR